jgi:hypothetical protein
LHPIVKTPPPYSVEGQIPKHPFLFEQFGEVKMRVVLLIDSQGLEEVGHRGGSSSCYESRNRDAEPRVPLLVLHSIPLFLLLLEGVLSEEFLLLNILHNRLKY